MNIGRTDRKSAVEAFLWALERLEIAKHKTFWWEDACYLADIPWEET